MSTKITCYFPGFDRYYDIEWMLVFCIETIRLNVEK